jgi:hypothetical protein
MNKVEQNAIKIAELLGYELVPTLLGTEIYYHLGDRFTQNEIRRLFSSYNGLMQIIESEISEYELKNIHFELKTNSLLEAVQNFVIKYLELKNGNSLGS